MIDEHQPIQTEYARMLNSHDALLDACRYAALWFEAQRITGGIPPTQKVIAALEDAIAKAME